MSPEKKRRAAGGGRKPKPPGEALGVRVYVYLTSAQERLLDQLRGGESRSAYLARMGGVTRAEPQR